MSCQSRAAASTFHAFMCLQTGTGQLTPNNPNSVASIVQYGYKPDKLDMSVTGAAEVCMPSCCASSPLPCLEMLLPTAMRRRKSFTVMPMSCQSSWLQRLAVPCMKHNVTA